MILCFVHSWSVTFTEENYQGYKGTKMDCFAIRIQRGMKIYPGLQVLQRFLIFIKRNICSLCVYVYAHVSVFSLFLKKISRDEEMIYSRNLFKDEMALIFLIQTNLYVAARGYYLSRRREKEVRNSSHSLSE